MQTRILNPKNTTKETIVEALQSKDNENDPICRPWTWVSTIMEFHDNYNVLLISPGKPDATDYEKFIIQ
jgi:hypothetical protein